MKAPEIKPDPELQRQEAAARQDKLTAIQDRVASVTDALIRTYGAKQAFSGASSSSMRAPVLGWGR